MGNTTDLKEVRPTDVTAKNIRFLRAGVGLSINELASIIEIDPISLYQYEQVDYTLNPIRDSMNLVDIANYFAIKLDLLVYTDLEKENVIQCNWFEQLRSEITSGKKADRKQFRKSVLDDYVPLGDEDTLEWTLRSILNTVQKTVKLQDRYYNLRSAGLIDKDEFFEG